LSTVYFMQDDCERVDVAFLRGADLTVFCRRPQQLRRRPQQTWTSPAATTPQTNTRLL